ncbi:Cleft lip and palate transmembrane protein 1-like protein [Hypsibius exemplaris]|uniref:Cleft lip and palate transmembrane protein 1-like protein n=1 Tax=Hypsibius exemplaris TaxID=2072580 RepID=A0A1W0WE31_HYPEX|nr:Cleft lip and palate transmembrane protein 1-like protein [Hypsibius exemplaris]
MRQCFGKTPEQCRMDITSAELYFPPSHCAQPVADPQPTDRDLKVSIDSSLWKFYFPFATFPHHLRNLSPRQALKNEGIFEGNPSAGKMATAGGAQEVARQNAALPVPNAAGNDAADPAGAPPPAAAGGRSYWDIAKMLASRAVFMYFISQFLSGRKAPTPTTTTGPDGAVVPLVGGQNIFGQFMPMDMYVYVSEKPKYYKLDEDHLVWKEKEIRYGDWTGGENSDGAYTHSTTLPVPEAVQKNASNLYLHVYFVRSGASPKPTDTNYNPAFTIQKSFQLNKMKKVLTGQRKQNLLTGETALPFIEVKEGDEPAPPSVMMSHWHPNLTINLVDDRTSWTKGRAPSPLSEYLEFNAAGDYFPILYFNDYWNLNKDYMPINETTKTLNLTLSYYPLSLFRWQLYVSQSMSNKWSKMLNGDFLQGDGGTDSNVITDDNDSIKEALLDTNPILLGLTIVISLCHTVFEFMAFKNDIQFWKNKGEDLEGLSVRSVFLNVVQSVIVLLYVMDNDTNPMVRLSIGVGLAIEIWKVKKVMNINVDWNNKIFGLVPRVRIEDKKSYVESSTRVYDKLAFKYLSWVLFPLILAYGAYSLMYEEHKGWYSWVLGMLYGFLLTFGFIAMTPQLFINYKLKSVAHLPWRMMTYKALNTFIDDIFAFVIKMPTMYRIGCLRDDVIFFIFLYQRWVYRVDPSRRNEYGISKDMLDHKAGQVVVVDGPEASVLAPAAVSSASDQETETAVREEPPTARQRKSKGSRARKEE